MEQFDLGELFTETCAKVWACSDFAKKLCEQKPWLLQQLFSSGHVNTVLNAAELDAHLIKLLAECTTQNDFYRVLREVRNQQLLRITWRDLSGWCNVQETLDELSTVADLLVQHTVQFLTEQLEKEYGQPCSNQNEVQTLVILALGKLGGRELNFSSDIDLLFCYPKQGKTNGAHSIENQQFFTQLGQQVIAALNEITVDGFVYRVDMRLRPFGESGALVQSFSALEIYYQEQGRDWERYALLKARPITGTAAQRNQVMALVNRFVYRRYVDFGIIETLRELKKLMDAEARRSRLKDNLKRGSGGIREVEFIIQSLQLIRGGKEPLLQTGQWRLACERLVDTRHLQKEEAAILVAAYDFLRTAENRLQMIDDLQSQNLPTLTLAQEKLAKAMNQRSWEEFVSELNQHRKNVTILFSNLEATENRESEQVDEVPYLQLWQAKEFADTSLAPWGELAAREEFFMVLQQFKQSYALRKISPKAKERLQKVMPRILAMVLEAECPVQTLQRLLSVLEVISRRSVYLALLKENPNVLVAMVKLCSASQWLTQQLARYPILLDELLDSRMLTQQFSKEDLHQELRRCLLLIPEQELEQTMEALRQFKHSHTLRLCSQQIIANQDPESLGRQLSNLAEIILEQVLLIGWKQLAMSHGAPGAVPSEQFAIIAYGSLGAGELTYQSDLDLVFVYEGDGQQQTTGDKPITFTEFFSKLGQRIAYLLTTRTHSGVLYDIDNRLRPSGSAGLLVTRFAAYGDYQMKEAWTWEHQALVKARLIFGSSSLLAQFSQIRVDALCLTREEKKLQNQIVSMRDKMLQQQRGERKKIFNVKNWPGGITDIEFMVHYWILLYGRRVLALEEGWETRNLLFALADQELIDKESASILLEALHSYRQFQFQQALEQSRFSEPPLELTAHLEKVRSLWQQVFVLSNEE